MELKVAIRVTDEKDRKHLSTTLRLANQRQGQGQLRLVETELAQSDVVILRRGEPESALLLRACEAANHPIPVIYTTSNTERSSWVLRWPARTTDLLPLAETLYLRLQRRLRENAGPAGEKAH